MIARGRVIAAVLALGSTVAGASIMVSAANPGSPDSLPDQGAEVPPRCSGGHPVRGHGQGIDLVRVERAYQDVARAVASDLGRARGTAARGRVDVETLDRPYDAGLPACERTRTSTVTFDTPVPRALRGRALAFIRAGSDRLPGPVRSDPRAGVFVVEAPSMGKLSELADHLGRPIMLADGGLARALSIRCAPAWIRISSSGREGVVHEGR